MRKQLNDIKRIRPAENNALKQFHIKSEKYDSEKPYTI